MRGYIYVAVSIHSIAHLLSVHLNSGIFSPWIAYLKTESKGHLPSGKSFQFCPKDVRCKIVRVCRRQYVFQAE